MTITSTTLPAAIDEAIEVIELAMDAYEPGFSAATCIDMVADCSVLGRVLARGTVADVADWNRMHATKILRAALDTLLRQHTAVQPSRCMHGRTFDDVCERCHAE